MRSDAREWLDGLLPLPLFSLPLASFWVEKTDLPTNAEQSQNSSEHRARAHRSLTCPSALLLVVYEIVAAGVAAVFLTGS
jgi:hypothetical protein